jgi:S-DNA-T family DNA segregation ATPase FtsK/SpoIIIE
MELELVCATPDGTSAAVLVTAPDGTPVGPIRLALQEYFGTDDGALYAGFARLPDTASPATRELVHGGALVHGATVGLGYPVVPVTSGDAPLVDSGECEMAVVGGLYGGSVTPLRSGEQRCLGRRHDADLVLADPETSRTHAWVSLDQAGVVWVTDAGSRNGVRLRGRVLAEDPAVVGVDTFELGETVVEVRARVVADALTSLDGNGSVRFDRPHRSVRPSAPDPATVVALACGPSARLWERRTGDTDFLVTRLGLADHPPVYDEPVTVPLAGRVLGLAGTPRPALLAAARAVVAQVAALHAPGDLRLVVISQPDRARDWEWASWLPHTRPVGGSASCQRMLAVDLDQARARLAELRVLVRERSAGAEHEPAVLVVVDETRPLRGLPEFAELLTTGPSVGVSMLCLAADPRTLSNDCRTTLVTSTSLGTRAVLRQPGTAPAHDVLLDGLTAHHATRLARSMAPLRLSRSTRLPATERFIELADLPLSGRPEPDAELVRRHRTTIPDGQHTSVLLGTGPAGTVSVDLDADGPHVLVAGAADTGKSGLLATITTALALRHEPETLTVAVFGHRESAALAACARLPHCTGPHLSRAGTAELRRLAEELRSRAAVRGDTPTSPLWRRRLLIVVDDLDDLADEVPEFLTEIARIGVRARGLGVHLVLSARRPGEVLTADLRACLGVRICLRVAGENESRDMLGTPDAARLSSCLVGRAMLRSGDSRPTAVQVARMDWPRECPPSGVTVRKRELSELGRPASMGEHDDLTTLVAAIAAADERTVALPGARL